MTRFADEVRNGSMAAVRPAEDLVRFALQSRLRWLVGKRPLRARNGHVHWFSIQVHIVEPRMIAVPVNTARGK
jgi:hypothetical protein